MRSIAIVFLALLGCSAPPIPEPEVKAPASDNLPRGFTAEEIERILDLSPLPDPPPDPTNRFYEDERAAHLGQFLFYETRLSGSGEVSCATCHLPNKDWGDGKKLGEAEGQMTRHTMTLWNVAYNRWFFWDGRADSLWAQALGPLEEPREHAGSRLRFAHLMHDDADLRRAYTQVFGALPDLDDASRFPPEGRPVPGDPEHPHAKAWEGMREEDRVAVNRVFANIGKSIAAFERKLVSRRSSFDDFVAGIREGDLYKQMELHEDARRGLKLFLGKARCFLCHSGPNFTDREFHDTRVPPLKGGKRLDPGRYDGVEKVIADPFNGTGAYSDDPGEAAEVKVDYLIRNGHNWSEFKTPSLRNSIVTAPYMHQGQFATLDEVLEYYSTLEGAVVNHHQAERTLVPVNLTEGEKRDLHAFLEALTDLSLDPALKRKPETPYLP